MAGIGASKSSLHAKSFILDRLKVFIGSLNLDPRALVFNTEIGVVMTSPEIGEDMGNIFDSFVKQKVRRDLAGTQQEPFRLDLSVVEHARAAAERGDHDEVIAILESWPGLLVMCCIRTQTTILKRLSRKRFLYCHTSVARSTNGH